MTIKKEMLKVFNEIEKDSEEWGDYLPEYDRACVCDIFSYMEQYMSWGKFKKDTLLIRTWKKTLTHEEFYDLCENILNLLEFGPWDELGEISDFEIVLVIATEQAAALMPLTIDGYETMYKFDVWQEMNGDEDIGAFDSAMTEIFSNPECRQLIEKYARQGQYLDMAEHIGVTKLADELKEKLKKISDDENFLASVPIYLETNEELLYMVNAIDKGIVKESSEVIMLVEDIENARDAANGEGDYLSGIEIDKKV